MTFIFALTLSVVAAASPKDAFPTDAHGSPITPGSDLKSPDACAAAGGSWQQVGFVAHACAIPAPDAGKSCKDSSECGGSCLVDLHRRVLTGAKVGGTCSAHYIVWGCTQLVEHGRVGEAICVD